MPNKIIIEDFRRGQLEIWEKDEDNEINISITSIGNDEAYIFINKSQAQRIIEFLQKQL